MVFIAYRIFLFIRILISSSYHLYLHRESSREDMPASSRKRNKGRDRRAKKAAKEGETAMIELQKTWRRWEQGNMGSCNIQCKHGFGEVLPNKSHPVLTFIDYLSVCLWNPEPDAMQKDIITNFEDVWNNDNNRKLAAIILIKIGANLLCTPNTIIYQDRKHQQFIINIAYAITMLEDYDEGLDYDSNSANLRYIDLYCGSTNAYRDLLKFYRKRMKCKCLKKMHLEARKTHPKLGGCHNCGVVKERSLLMVCSRCMVAPYCSRECQVAASPKHRSDCDILVRAQQA